MVTDTGVVFVQDIVIMTGSTIFFLLIFFHIRIRLTPEWGPRISVHYNRLFNYDENLYEVSDKKGNCYGSSLMIEKDQSQWNYLIHHLLFFWIKIFRIIRMMWTINFYKLCSRLSLMILKSRHVEGILKVRGRFNRGGLFFGRTTRFPFIFKKKKIL